jgi:hypothetical protein
MPKADTKIVLSEINGEMRIRDEDLGERLGFAKPAKIRELIERHKETLCKINILPTAGKIHVGAGRPATVYYLDKKQAIFITAKSETGNATDLTIEIIERFVAYERGAAPRATVIEPAEPPEQVLDLSGSLSLVRETRQSFGVAAAQQMWLKHTTLPTVPAMFEPQRQPGLFEYAAANTSRIEEKAA